jgi:hypothetical protein
MIEYLIISQVPVDDASWQRIREIGQNLHRGSERVVTIELDDQSFKNFPLSNGITIIKRDGALFFFNFGAMDLNSSEKLFIEGWVQKGEQPKKSDGAKYMRWDYAGPEFAP